MSKSKHTPGPWTSMEDTDGAILLKTKCRGSFRSIAVIPAEPRISEYDWANAQLIAAAPEMLEALEKLCNEPECPDHISDYLSPILAKAKGE